jgi:HPt (histidine-containing phosphotransfer) domain-containing protein
MNPADTPVLDTAMLRETLGPDPEDVAMMLPGFVEAASRQLGEFEEAAHSGDRDAARQAVHRLGSSLGFIGACRLSDQARDLERELLDRPDPDLVARVQPLRDGWEALQQALEELELPAGS